MNVQVYNKNVLTKQATTLFPFLNIFLRIFRIQIFLQLKLEILPWETPKMIYNKPHFLSKVFTPEEEIILPVVLEDYYQKLFHFSLPNQARCTNLFFVSGLAVF